jgi:hypothetical protein
LMRFLNQCLKELDHLGDTHTREGENIIHLYLLG